MSFASGTYGRTALVNARATREWCEAQKHHMNVNDATLTEVRDAYNTHSLHDVAGTRLVSLSDRSSYLLNRLIHNDPYYGSRMPWWSELMDFAADDQFGAAMNFLKRADVPVVLVWLPQYKELVSGARALTMQTRKLKESLVRLSGFPLIDLLEPLVSDVEPLSKLSRHDDR
jgi:hypothetical protein